MQIAPVVLVAGLITGIGGLSDRLGPAAMLRLHAGIDVALTEDRLIRLGILRSTHGKGFPGPNGFVVGITQRFGTRR